MSLKKKCLAWIYCLVALVATDVPFFLMIGKSFYRQHLGHIMRTTPELLPGALLYFLYSFGVMVFVLAPALRSGQAYGKTLLYGMLFGAVVSGTYDLTNQALLHDWSSVVSMYDMAWVSCLTGAVALFSQWAVDRV